jgi:hypothetical protein
MLFSASWYLAGVEMGSESGNPGQLGRRVAVPRRTGVAPVSIFPSVPPPDGWRAGKLPAVQAEVFFKFETDATPVLRHGSGSRRNSERHGPCQAFWRLDKLETFHSIIRFRLRFRGNVEWKIRPSV